MVKPNLNLLLLEKYPIFSQLQLEEALLRTSLENYCIINMGSEPAVVMGISGKKDELVTDDCTLPIIRRFSGGGCVVVDENTLFFTLIGNSSLSLDPFPEPILTYTAELFKPMYPEAKFQLTAQDFVIDTLKVGGNALYLKKDHWLIHTSFLWDFKPERMNSLKMPKKTPEYRKGRSHEDFITTLNKHFENKEVWKEACIKCLEKKFTLHLRSLEELKKTLDLPHRKVSSFI